MIREKLNQDWQFARGSTSMMSAFMGGPQFEAVNLPHDAMVHEERTPDTANGTQTGYWPGGLYTYVKKLAVPTRYASSRATPINRTAAGIREAVSTVM